jgi:hypothetical protein
MTTSGLDLELGDNLFQMSGSGKCVRIALKGFSCMEARRRLGLVRECARLVLKIAKDRCKLKRCLPTRHGNRIVYS